MKTLSIIGAAFAHFAIVLFAQDLPDGFTSDIVVSELHQPCGLAFLPDGRLLITEEDQANVRVHAQGEVGLLGTIPMVAFPSERGLTGIAVDPLWPTWPYIYLFYHHAPTSKIRISRFTVTGDLSDPASSNLVMGNEYLLLDDIPDDHPWHNGGTVRFGPDGYLYATLGDDLVPCDSQDPTHMSGCVLRMDIASVRGATGTGPPPPSALIAPGNPWTGPNAELMWAIGLRQPFRFSIDAVTGDLFIADVGSWLWEEVDQCPSVGAGGLNFGWPEREGSQPSLIPPCGVSSGLTDPIAEYAHYGSGGNAVIIVAGTYRNQPGGAYNFGSEYEGDLFIADFRKAWLRRYKWDGTSWNIAAPVPGQPTATEWATGLNRITDGVVGPDGDLYYTNRQQDLVGRIRRGAGPANEIALMAEQSMAGATVTLQNANLVTGSEYFNLFSLEPCSTGVGHGPYLGLCTSAPTLLLNQFYTPVGTNPSHFIATSPTMTWGPYAILPMMVDGVTFEWTDGGIGQVSSVTRFLVQ